MYQHSHLHHRRSLRLKEFDYSQPGQYFITIVAQNGECLFGEITNGEMVLNDAGRMAVRWYSELERKFPDAKCGGHVVMPNHFHGIIELAGNQSKQVVGADLCVCPETEAGEHTGSPLRGMAGEHTGSPLRGMAGEHTGSPLRGMAGEHTGSPLRGMAGEHTGSPLHRIVQWFKTMTTNEYIRRVKTDLWTPFTGKLWQRNYYEHVIRNERELHDTREYIMNNPMKWEMDEENPHHR